MSFTERVSELFAASFFRSSLRVGTDRTFPSSAGSSFFVAWLVSFVVMARGDINVLPANVPEDMDWVEDVVLLSKSVVDEELLASFREAHAVCSTVEEESKYELVAPTSEERCATITSDVLFECRVAPTQLHPNSWGFMKAFQSVCWYLQLNLSLRAFFYFFHLTRPFSQKKSRWASFRAREGRRIFSLYEESFHDFKNYYFKVRVVEGFRPFFENERGEYQFRLYWYSGPESPKFDFNDLGKGDQEVVTVLKECCTKAPFNTKTLLTRSPSYVRTELEKMTNNSDAYKRMRARKKNQANRLAAASGSKDDSKSSSSPVSRVPPPGSESQAASGPETQPTTEGPKFKIPKTPATAADQSKSKKKKAFGHSYGSVYAPDFDVIGFTDEFIMENSRIAMDEAGLKGNLEYMMRAGIKAAAISRALQKKLAECPPTSRAELEQLKEKVAALEKGKEEAEGELSEAQAKLAKMKKSAKEAERLRKKAEADAAELQKKVGGLEADLAKLKEEYEELEDDSIKSNDNIVENLRLQAKILVPTLKVHLLHPDNCVAGSQIVWCSDLLPESGGPYFEEQAVEDGNAEKSVPEVGAEDAEKTPSV
ncbi:hypothetical protein PIB30_040538 [Stylosanthes scabra]|uniref:Uncharacterized protein n=1 Tax=Stylosanthes scabra TaxID=79078 RepID=A0ABU6TFD5_9FABA|nr:hypothetical protein [Stylosanthes scabra]